MAYLRVDSVNIFIDEADQFSGKLRTELSNESWSALLQELCGSVGLAYQAAHRLSTKESMVFNYPRQTAHPKFSNEGGEITYLQERCGSVVQY
jgi:hypothetical protein